MAPSGSRPDGDGPASGAAHAPSPIRLPRDESVHDWAVIEWWYFNGFLRSRRNSYSFMTCLFKADKEKVNLAFLRVPFRTVYFAHTLLYRLSEGEVEKEVLPVVLVSQDSFTRRELFINYAYPLRLAFLNYEISRRGREHRLKTRFFDLTAESVKPPLLEGGKGFLELGAKSTYYYSLPRMRVAGLVGNEKVSGVAWHDRQWSGQGFTDDYWTWFSLQLPGGLDVVCFDYRNARMATVSDRCNRQETVHADFLPVGRAWTSPHTGIPYHLRWRIRIKNMVIDTGPMIRDCEMNHGFISYWEGPVWARVGSRRCRGFMEVLSRQHSRNLTQRMNQFRRSFGDALELWNR